MIEEMVSSCIRFEVNVFGQFLLVPSRAATVVAIFRLLFREYLSVCT